MSGILYEESPLVVNPELARILGLNEAIILQQLHYWISKNTNVRDGKSWVYNTIQEWREQFSFWSANTIRRTMESLQKDGVVLTANYNERKFDKTLWYTINYEELDAIVKNRKSSCPKRANASAQNGQKQLPKMGKPIPETTKDYTEIITPKGVSTRFQKPTIEEIQAYCRERENNVDVVKFFNHYEAVGWHIGKAPMKNWRACVITWERTDSKQRHPPKKDNSADALREALNAVRGQ